MQPHPAAGRDQKGRSGRQEPEGSLAEVYGVVHRKETCQASITVSIFPALLRLQRKDIFFVLDMPFQEIAELV